MSEKPQLRPQVSNGLADGHSQIHDGLVGRSQPSISGGLMTGRGSGKIGGALVGGIGPYSRALDRGAVGGAIDGRSREGRFLRSYEKILTEHLGGKPSVTQRCLIQRAARIALHLELMDERALVRGHVFGEHDHNYYVSWSNSLARMLDRLGLDAPDVPAGPSLADHLATLAAGDEDEAA